MSGDETNKWLNNAPVKGDGTGGFPGGGGGIEVRPDGLKKFSSQATEEGKNFMTSYGAGVAPLGMQANRIGASFAEAANFTGRHGQALEATGIFAGDVGIGLSALGLGAMTISINYINGDATSAATLPQVLSAFDPSKGNGLRGQIGNTGQLPKKGEEAPVKLPEAQPINTKEFTNPNDPSRSVTVPLGDNASYTVPGVRDCTDIEMATPDSTKYVGDQFRDDLGKEDWKPAPYDPKNYR